MLNKECGWEDGDRSVVVLQTLKEMRMELRQQHPANRIANTEMVACHFLQRDCMDPGHPSRLPDGSLRSAWTGPGRDPNEFTDTRKWQALYRRRRCASHWSAPNILSITNK